MHTVVIPSTEIGGLAEPPIHTQHVTIVEGIGPDGGSWVELAHPDDMPAADLNALLALAFDRFGDTRGLDERVVRDTLAGSGSLKPGETIVCYSLVVATRYRDGSGDERRRRHRVAPAGGCDPHLSLGLLEAAAAELRRDLSGGRTP